MILYMYIAPGQGLTTPWGRNFDVKGNILSLRSFVASFKNITMYIALGQGQTAPRGQSFDVNRKVLSLYPFVANLKKITLKPDFIHFFHDLKSKKISND